MGSIHPIFRDALAPFAPKDSPQVFKLQPFHVKAGNDEATVMAYTVWDAASIAADLFNDGSRPAPAGLEISIDPVEVPKCAA